MTAVHLLARHPGVELAQLTSRSFAGQPYAAAFPLLETTGVFVEGPEAGAVDVVFSCLPHNAGASRAQRWANNDTTAPMSERAFRSNIDFPGTRNYVASVLQRYEFYRKRGQM